MNYTYSQVQLMRRYECITVCEGMRVHAKYAKVYKQSADCVYEDTYMSDCVLVHMYEDTLTTRVTVYTCIHDSTQ